MRASLSLTHNKMYIYTKKIKLPSVLETILKALQAIGVKPVVVGGCIRDSLLGIPCKDYDIEIFSNGCLDSIEKVLKTFGSVKHVGKSFGVLILRVDGYDFDFAVARTEKTTGRAHKHFEVTTNAKLSYKEAALRRDFTINSIGYDFFEDKLLDPYNGLEDLKKGILRHVNDETFMEDPLRVYRGVQFVSRFDIKMHEKTVELCKKMVEEDDLDHLPRERVFQEFKKLFLKSKKPSVGLSLLKDLRILKHYPEMQALIGCEQDHEHHPEGDVWVHTLMTMDELAKIIREEKIEDEYRKLYLFYGLLCHDFGKPFCTQTTENGRVTSHRHEALGIEPTISFLERLTSERKFIDIVCTLVKNHLAPFQLYVHESSLKAVKRLSLRVNIEDLCLVCLADCLGRDIPDKDKCPKATSWLLEKAKELNIQNEALKPFVQGKDLLALGLKPGPHFKGILDFAFDLQIDEHMAKEQIIEELKKEYSL